ncbi:hypothetical protein SAMN05444287_1908 [Octadecabacter temperatus]|uniref:Uncharacterized protein n=1 Tax=Octadecabacter temperatus TaxID=1458307 RepID=A0A0K0Y786_9RHOB|nr:hypothetical protein [Octadecabacter temperatus]AKS46785.1 hypothetical protein OSB_22480 [Octadecabacter temperatus]SIO21172.1 hypothetical protein SAMN05444287_1908 [Octadecabacter temperatus]
MKRKLALAALVSLSSSVALANTIPEVGCFTRIYSADHLASNPNQGVAAMRLLLVHTPEYAASVTAVLDVTMADQGQGRADNVGGHTLSVGLGCLSMRCHSDGDAGGIDISRQSSDGITFQGSALLGDWEQDHLPSSSLSEGTGQPTVYRLNAASAGSCEGMY